MSEPVPAEVSFEDALTELENIVRELEDGSIGLEQSLARYEVGVGLLKQCYAKLAAAEKRIVQLAGIDADGNAVLEPFAHSAAVEPVTKRKREPK
jgi:exodeoxyribonuclease VII small subunit